MIYAYTTAKDSLQTLGHLYRKGYLRQKEQHLPTLVYCLLDKMDIYLGLPARRDAMQKDDILGHELHQDLIVCILLYDAQGINPLGMWLSAVVQSSYFLLVSMEYASVAQSFKNSGIAMRIVEKLIARKCDFIATRIDSRQLQESHHRAVTDDARPDLDDAPTEGQEIT